MTLPLFIHHFFFFNFLFTHTSDGLGSQPIFVRSQFPYVIRLVLDTNGFWFDYRILGLVGFGEIYMNRSKFIGRGFWFGLFELEIRSKQRSSTLNPCFDGNCSLCKPKSHGNNPCDRDLEL